MKHAELLTSSNPMSLLPAHPPNSAESYIDCQTHAAREVALVLSGKEPTTEVKDPWLLAEAQDEGFGAV
jgi:hypothetical protein